MLWPILGSIFVASIFLLFALVFVISLRPNLWKRTRLKISLFYLIWFIPYSIFILFFTGPNDLNIYPKQDQAKYKLPWASGVTRFVTQGNRSFTSHRDMHFYAWDFAMPLGAEILASRDGNVIKIVQNFSGIGFKSNYLWVQHEDGEISSYAHFQKNSVLVKLGDFVRQGQPIALNGMVGQTTLPHVHFVVFNRDATESIPVSFQDVPGGVPLAGHFYTSGNQLH